MNNLLNSISQEEFINLANQRVIPNHCDITMPMDKFKDWINGDEGEFVVDILMSQGLDSRYNVLNYPILQEAMLTVNTMKFNALGDFYDYMQCVTQIHNDRLNEAEKPHLPNEDAELKKLAEDGFGMIRAGINAVMNGGPTTYKGQKIQGLYLPNEDDFLKAHPELQPLQQVKAVTTCTWWTGFYDEGAPESTGELDMDSIGVVQPGYEFEIMYVGHGRFHIFDAINHEGILYPQELGSIDDHETVDQDEKIEYLKHFKLV